MNVREKQLHCAAAFDKKKSIRKCTQSKVKNFSLSLHDHMIPLDRSVPKGVGAKADVKPLLF